MNRLAGAIRTCGLLPVLILAGLAHGESSFKIAPIDMKKVFSEAVIQLTPSKKEAIKSKLRLNSAALLGKELHVVGVTTGPVKLTPQNIDKLLQPNTMIVERTGAKTITRQDKGTQVVQLPLKFTYIRRDGSTFSFRPDVRILQPLQYNRQADLFQGLLGFGVLDPAKPQSRQALQTPVSFALGGAVDNVNPRQFPITHLSQPFKEVVLQARNPGKAVLVNVISTASAGTDEISVPAVRPRLTVSVSPSSGIDGFGLSTAVVYVSADSGGAFSGKIVSLSSSIGRFNSNQLTLDSSGKAEATLRSSFVGASTIRASGYPFAAGAAHINFVWPVSFSIAAVIGAMAGAWLSRRRTESGFFRGLIFGLIGGVLGALGVNFLNLPVEIPAGEAFILVLTFFTAYFGPIVFKPLFPGAFGSAPGDS